MERKENMNSPITETSLVHSLWPLCPENIYDIVTWCRDYEKVNKFPVTIKDRFAIGLYQIHQGMEWKDHGVNKYEGYAAASLHLVMVAERCGLNIDPTLEINLKDFPICHMQHKAYDLLRFLSRAQQQIIYSAKTNKTKRKSRYSAEKLTFALAQCILILISCIPKELRVEAFEAATTIMTKELK